jgi:F-type H+-transporting ATPase subunit epsilon
MIPTVEGEIGILPGHIPLITRVAYGELRVRKGAETLYLVVAGGFAQISGDKVSVLAESAIQADQIDEHAAETAMKRAQEGLQNQELEPTEVDRLESIVRFSVAQIGVKRKKR